MVSPELVFYFSAISLSSDASHLSCLRCSSFHVIIDQFFILTGVHSACIIHNFSTHLYQLLSDDGKEESQQDATTAVY